MAYWFDETAPVGASRQVTFILDNDSDVAYLPTSTSAGRNIEDGFLDNDRTITRPCGIGSKAFVIGSGRLYMLSSLDTWIEVGYSEEESYA